MTPTGDMASSGCIGGQVMFQGVCMYTPTVEATRTPCGDVTEFCDTTATPKPQLACLTDTTRMPPLTPATVTLTGYVHPFSSGKSNSPMTIQIYKAADLAAGADIVTVTPIATKTVSFDASTATDPTLFRACDDSQKIGCIPTAPTACTTPPCKDGLLALGHQVGDEYCRLDGTVPTCSKRFRWEPRYSIPGVPTNTPLVIRTTGKAGAADDVWAVLVTWNVFLGTDDKACANDQATDCLDTTDMNNPKYQLNASLLSQADYFNIPNVAGLSSGIASGYGAVAGEIHDCGNVRITNAQVGVSPAGDRFTYFNGNPYTTLPDPSRVSTGTDRLGLFSSLNVKPVKVTVVASGLVGGEQVLLGKYSAVVYANSVAVVNINGGKPVQK